MFSDQQELEVLKGLISVDTTKRLTSNRETFYCLPSEIADVIPNDIVKAEDVQPILMVLVKRKRVDVRPEGNANRNFKISEQGRLYAEGLII